MSDTRETSEVSVPRANAPELPVGVTCEDMDAREALTLKAKDVREAIVFRHSNAENLFRRFDEECEVAGWGRCIADRLYRELHGGESGQSAESIRNLLSAVVSTLRTTSTEWRAQFRRDLERLAGVPDADGTISFLQAERDARVRVEKANGKAQQSQDETEKREAEAALIEWEHTKQATDEAVTAAEEEAKRRAEEPLKVRELKSRTVSEIRTRLAPIRVSPDATPEWLTRIDSFDVELTEWENQSEPVPGGLVAEQQKANSLNDRVQGIEKDWGEFRREKAENLFQSAQTAFDEERFDDCIALAEDCLRIEGGRTDAETLRNSAQQKKIELLHQLFELDDGERVIVRCRDRNATKVDIPEGVVTLGPQAFEGCTSLKSVTIPGSVTSIGDGAFAGCSGLTSVTIPVTVTSIGDEAFDNCNNVREIVWPGHCSLSSAFNRFTDIRKMFAKSGDDRYRFLECYGAQTAVRKVVVATGSTDITDSAFQGCSGLTSVTIPNSVTCIGAWAFEGCTGLTSVTIPDSVTEIGDYAFYGCSGLTSMTIPDSVTSIGKRAFKDCSRLTSITVGAGITSLDKIPTDVSAFIASPNSVTYSSRDGVLFSKDGETLIRFPTKRTGDYIIPDGVMKIGNDAFRGCSGLTSVTIPDSVTSIGSYAFVDCSGLTSVTANPKWSGQFWSATNLCFTIPDSVASIGPGAFLGRSGLTTVTIPTSVTSIGSKAFEGCSGLTSVTIPDSVMKIADDAFYGCSGLTISRDDILFSPNQKTLIRFPTKRTGDYIIPESVTKIGKDAFLNCRNLTSVTIPDSVTEIEDYAFYGCSGLTSVTIPDAVTRIGGFAFSSCSSLTSVTIPDSVTNIGDRAFDGCGKLAFVTADPKWLPCFPNVPDLHFTVPNGVTGIGEKAFAECRRLTSITLPQSIVSIENSAFRRCEGLTSIIIPDGVTNIGDEAFAGCSRLSSVTIPESVTHIGEDAFFLCTGLTSITAPDRLMDHFRNLDE